jgi:hypothetical protein
MVIIDDWIAEQELEKMKRRPAPDPQLQLTYEEPFPEFPPEEEEERKSSIITFDI